MLEAMDDKQKLN